MLTLIAYRFLLGQDLPKVPYLTRLDLFLIGSTVLVFLVLVEVTVTTRLHGEQQEERAARVDRHSRWVFPLVYLALFMAVFMS
jgi:cadmium resistance protein CadD (predicted permease)